MVRINGQYRINQSLMFALAIAEPIITILSSPLIVDLYSGSRLAMSCNRNYVLFVDAVSVLITLSSIATVFLCIQNILRLVPKLGQEIGSSINLAAVVTLTLNIILTSIFVSAITGNEPQTRNELDDDSCWYGFMEKNSIVVGLKSFIPQAFLCVLLLIIATCFCYNRSTRPEDQPYENQSLAIGVYLPIFSMFFFQLICFLLRFSFTTCTCGWYTMLARRMSGTLQLCFIKSVMLTSLEICLFIFMKRKYKDYKVLLS